MLRFDYFHVPQRLLLQREGRAHTFVAVQCFKRVRGYLTKIVAQGDTEGLLRLRVGPLEVVSELCDKVALVRTSLMFQHTIPT